MMKYARVITLGLAIGVGLIAVPAFAAHVISLTSASVPSQIGRTQVLSVPFTYNNTSGTTHKVTALLVFTKPGTPDGIEFYTTGLDAAPGSSTLTVSLDSAARVAKGVNPGRWLVTATGFDEGTGTRLETYPGNLLAIGVIGPTTLTSVSSLPSQSAVTDSLVGSFAFSNAGDTEDRVSALFVFTQPGSTVGKEIYKTGLVVSPGSVTHTVTLTPAELDANGIGAGLWLITRLAFDGVETPLQRFSGFLWSRGTLAVSLDSTSAIPGTLRPSDPLVVDFTFSNSGNAPDRAVSAVLVFTPAGGTTSTEFYTTNLLVNPGTATHRVTLTQAQREAKGVGAGHWRVTAIGFDGRGNRLQSFGGPLDIAA